MLCTFIVACTPPVGMPGRASSGGDPDSWDPAALQPHASAAQGSQPSGSSCVVGFVVFQLSAAYSLGHGSWFAWWRLEPWSMVGTQLRPPSLAARIRCSWSCCSSAADSSTILGFTRRGLCFLGCLSTGIDPAAHSLDRPLGGIPDLTGVWHAGAPLVCRPPLVAYHLSGTDYVSAHAKGP